MRKFLLPFAMMMAFGLAALPMQRASADDFIDLDLTNVAPGLRGAFVRAEQIWESRINGYSSSLPAAVQSQLTGRLTINANTFFDAPGGLLGFAGPDVLAQTFTTVGNPANGRSLLTTAVVSGSMSFDLADANGPQFADTVLHEMGHVLGIGTLWELNGIVNAAGTERGLLQNRRGLFQYIGRNGLHGFREQSGHHRANYVPTENFGGPGTALGHWAGGTSPNWFFAPANGSRVEILTGFATGAPTFISEATWGSLADVGWSVDGYNENEGLAQTFGPPTFSPFPKSGYSFNRVAAVPEPSSAVVLLAGLAGVFARRRRNA